MSKRQEAWNRCDVCGKFIAIADFGNGAIRSMVTPDTDFTSETYETLCIQHAKPKPPVHNHGPEEGPGLLCPERRMPDESLRGKCMEGETA